MTNGRSFSAFLLVLALVLTSVTQAMARSDVPGAGSIVICSGQGEITITLDEGGRPVSGPHHHCPDCTPALMGQAAAQPPEAPFVLGKRVIFPIVQGHRIFRPLPGASARAPPFPV